MKEISDIIKRVSKLEDEIEKLDAKISDKKQELKHYIETVLPDIFMDENITSITIDGNHLRMSKTFFVSLVNQEKAIKWFEKQGIDVFKRDIIVHCRDEEYKNTVLKQLVMSDYDYKVNFHWKTMSAQINALVDNGIDIPEDLIKVTEVNKVNIKRVN